MAKKKSTAPPSHPELTIQDVPLHVPSRDKPTGKTLIDIIDEQRPRHADGTPINATGDETDETEVFGPGMQAFTWTVPLMMLLFVLDYLTHEQYRQEVDVGLILTRVVKSAPIIFTLLYIFHPRRHWVSVQLFFFATSIAAGCWLVRAVNTSGYYAVMKRAPPVGTLWIWAAVEMSLGPLIVSSLVVASFTRWYGYGFI